MEEYEVQDADKQRSARHEDLKKAAQRHRVPARTTPPISTHMNYHDCEFAHCHGCVELVLIMGCLLPENLTFAQMNLCSGPCLFENLTGPCGQALLWLPCI